MGDVPDRTGLTVMGEVYYNSDNMYVVLTTKGENMNVRVLSGTPLFQGIKEQEIEAMLQCLSAEEKEFEKDAYLYRTGDITGRLGIVGTGKSLRTSDRARFLQRHMRVLRGRP